MTVTDPVIAILGGTGSLGRALAARWSRAGYRVVIGSRSRPKAREAAQAMAAEFGVRSVVGTSNGAATAEGDVVVLAVPFSKQESLLTQIRAALSGKILLTAVVPLAPPAVRHVHLPAGGSAARAAQDTLGDDVHVVSAFQNVSAGLLARDGEVDCDVLVSGDEPEARQRVMALIEAIGLRAWDAGVLANAVAAEALTPVLLHINEAHGLSGAGVRISRGRPFLRPRGPTAVSLHGLVPFPLVQEGDDLVELIGRALRDSGQTLWASDVLIVAHKIVSKAEGRAVRLGEVAPSERARRLAAEVEMDARLVELILSESTEVVGRRRGVLIVAHRLGMVLANAGIDRSNVGDDWKDEVVLLLPRDPDRSAAEIGVGLHAVHGINPGVIISDTGGRAWRNGGVGMAIGAAGLTALEDLRGRRDLFGRPLASSRVGRADEIASAASLVMGQADEGIPVVMARGLGRSDSMQSAADLLRPKEQDLFR